MPYAYLPARPGPIRVDAFARVLADDLVARSEPFIGAGSAILAPRLAAGDRLFVVAGPVQGSGYRWYQVAGMPRDAWHAAPFGWVAAASRAGQPWIEGLEVACPGRPVGIGRLVQLAAEERLACFGRAELTFAAWARGIGMADGPMWGTPGWLVPGHDYWYVGGRTGPTMDVVFAPGSVGPGPGTPPSSEEPWGVGGGPARYRITGHFDDPASKMCRAGSYDPTTGVRDERPVAEARLICRTRFVITERRLLGGP